MKVFGNQTTTEISPGQNYTPYWLQSEIGLGQIMPPFTGENGNFSIENKYQFLYIFLLLKIVRNIIIIFTDLFVYKKQLNNQIGVITPVVTVLIFDGDLQYHMKQNCRLFQSIPPYYSQFQSLLAYSSTFQHIPA